jgi:solute carrier family 13 (sodium-dependent dicarboxylate transporter), member 2/3/5
MSDAPTLAEVYSPAEEAFERARRTTGLVLAPLLFGLVLLAPLGLDPPAHRMAAILAAVTVLYATEALPLPVTALLGPALAVILQVAPPRAALAGFADPIIFLVMGGFIIGQAMVVHGLDRRIAYRALSIPGVSTSALRVLLVHGALCAGISMWISNTATTAMMFPIGLSIVAQLARDGRTPPAQVKRFAMAVMLLTAFAASVGGMGTPMGTAPNLIGIGLLDKVGGTHVSFAAWTLIGLPMVLLLFALLIAVFYWSAARPLKMEGSAAFVRDELARLGPLTPAQRNVAIVFAITVVLWSAPGALALLDLERTALGEWYATSIPESVAGLIGAVLLFVLPIDWRARRFTMTWPEAAKIDWGVLLLFGGGLAMGELVFQTGLAKAMGEFLTSRLPAPGTVSLTIVFTAAAIVLSEATSNTASANMIVPIAIAVAQAAGVRAVEPALGATFGCSMGFMMPISTPPNAIVYSSGYVPIGQMIRHGLLLDVVGFIVIVAVVLTIAPLIL